MLNHTTSESTTLSLSLRDLATVLFRRWRMMLMVFLLIAAGATAVAVLLPNKYESRMKLLVRNARVDAPVTPERAHAVLQSVAALYQEKHLQVHRPPGTHDFFAAQATHYEQQLRAAEAELSRHQQRLQVVSLEQEKDLNLRQMIEARAALQATETALNETTKRIEASQRELLKQQPRVVTLNRVLPYQQSVERLSTMLVELQNRRTQLLTRFQPTDRLVQEIEQQVKDPSAALDAARKHTAVEESSDLNPVRQNLIGELEKAKLEQADLQAKRATLAQQVQQYEALLARLDNGTNAHSELARQVKTLAENYQLYTRKRDEALIADAMDQRKITNISLTEAPTKSALPSSPNRWLNLALGVFLASFFSVVSAVSAEIFRDTVLTARELEALQMSFDYILIDCPSLKTSPAAALLAPLVDDLALVVEAGRTRRDEIQSAQRTVELTKAPFLGFVLNKRKYPVPEWLYRRL